MFLMFSSNKDYLDRDWFYVHCTKIALLLVKKVSPLAKQPLNKKCMTLRVRFCPLI